MLNSAFLPIALTYTNTLSHTVWVNKVNKNSFFLSLSLSLSLTLTKKSFRSLSRTLSHFHFCHNFEICFTSSKTRSSKKAFRIRAAQKHLLFVVAVASDTRDPRIESGYGQYYLLLITSIKTSLKRRKNKKEAGNGPFLKKKRK